MNQVIALSPTDLVPAQQSLIGWCEQRVAHWDAQKVEAQAGLDHAVKNKWKQGPFKVALAKATKKVGFYTKVRSAIEAGYLMVPNFPLEIFAIRTTKTEARSADSTSNWQRQFEQKPSVLPEGAGEYKSPIPEKLTYDDTDKEGKDVTHYYPGELEDELEVPMHLVKPQIMAAVDRARALRLFDQIGVSTDRRGDPIVCGQILSGTGWSAKRVTFFVAWFVDLDTL